MDAAERILREIEEETEKRNSEILGRHRQKSARNSEEGVASLAYHKLTPRIVRYFAESEDKLQIIKNYVSGFANRTLNRTQLNSIVKIFLGYIKDKISQIENIREQIANFSSYGSRERKEREGLAFNYILSEINRKGRIASRNSARTFQNLTVDFYNAKGFEAKPYEIRNIVLALQKRTIQSRNEIISLESQLREFHSLNSTQDRKDRMNLAYRTLLSYFSGGKEIRSHSPLETLKKSVVAIYEKLNFPVYKNEIEMTARSIFTLVSYNNKVLSLEKRLIPNLI
ncbi:MAG: hypothetical protein ABIH49_02195 [archaeon]